MRIVYMIPTLLFGFAGLASAQDEYLFADNLGDDYLSAVNSVARQLRTSQAWQIEQAGGWIAARVRAGKPVFVYDRDDALWLEARTQAGGLPAVRQWKPDPAALDKGAPGAGDLLIVFMQTLSTNETNLARFVLGRGAKVIVVFPMVADDPRTLAILRLDVLAIDNCSGTGRGALTVRGFAGRYVGSLAAPAELLTLWAMLSEATEQLLGQGFRPRVFLGGRAKVVAEANAAVAALEPGAWLTKLGEPLRRGEDEMTLSIEYLSMVYRTNADISGQSIFPEKPPYPLEQAVAPSLKAARAGRVFFWNASRVVARLLGGQQVGRPEFAHPLEDASRLKAGDVLWLGDAGGQDPAAAALAQKAKQAGVTVIAYGPAPAAGEDPPALVGKVDFYLALKTPASGGILTLPGTQTPIGPVQTLVQVEGFWMLALRTYQKLLPAPPAAEPPGQPSGQQEPGPFG